VEQSDFVALQSVVINNQRRIQAVESRLKQVAQRVEASSQPQAGMVADMDAMRQEVARLRGQLDEINHQMGDVSQEADLEKRLADSQATLEGRLQKVETYLGLASGGKPQKGSDSSAKPAQPSGGDLYDLGLKLYKDKSYDAARDRFEAYLKRYPKGRRAPNAHFWIGESFYAQKRYEEAILAYNQVIKRFTGSSKTPPALYKQGLAFAALGDKRTARIVLNKLIQGYPKSSQAKAAKKQLAKLK
jgi:tol-pal system protein YbgF